MAFTAVQYIRQVAVAVVVAGTTQYTVPASRQDVLKCISVCNSTAGTVTLILNIAGVSLLSSVAIPANQTIVLTGTWVLNAGETIFTQASATGLYLVISGLESQ